MKSLRIGIRLPAAGPAKDVLATVRRAEAAGLDSVWFPDSHLNYREVWSMLGAAAVSTDRVELGVTVTNLVTRHPTVTASAARTIGEASDGRFILGLGAGDSALGFDNLRHSGVKELEAGVGTLKTLLSGGSVRYGEFDASLRDASVDVPVYLAGSGPRTLRTGGAVADGVIVMLGALDEKLAHVAAGATDNGRTEPPPVFVYTACLVTEDIERASRLLKPFCIRIAQLEGVEVFENAGVRVEVPNHTVGAHGDVGHPSDLAAAARDLDDLVSDEAALWFAQNRVIIGTEDEVVARLRTLGDLGVAGVALSHLTGSQLPDRLIESLVPIMEATRAGA